MKLLITQATFVPSIDGPAFLSAHETVDLEKDSAHAVVTAGKGLYIDKKDDPTRNKNFTATDKQIEAAAVALVAAQEAAKAAEADAAAAKAGKKA